MPTKPKGAPEAPALNPGQQIREARRAANWSQAELGHRLGGLSRARVSAIESWDERTRPSLEWFLSHGEVWIELGLSLRFFAEVSGRPERCPHCKRPY